MRTPGLNGLPLLVLAALSGCAFGNTHTFDYQPQARSQVGRGIVVVLFPVVDQRLDVLSGDEGPAWVGEQRGGFGNPFNVNTTGRRPFAELVTETLRRDLAASGFEVVVSDEISGPDAAEVLRRHGASRGVSVVMQVFSSDTYTDIDLEWDFRAAVLDADGRELASHGERGKEELEGGALNPPKIAKRKVPPFFYDIAHRLVAGNEEILAALTSGG